jgi:hypothetical protein
MRRIDETGKRYGSWMVLKRSENSKTGAVRYLCRCSCGKEKLVQVNSLRNGDSRSCGCLFRDTKSLANGHGAFYWLLANRKRAAKKRHHEWHLSDEEFRSLITRPCYYCGCEPNQGADAIRRNRNGAFLYNGIDRKDNSLGYTWENVVPCCKTCNQAKHTMSVDEFRNWINKVYTYLSIKG